MSTTRKAGIVERRHSPDHQCGRRGVRTGGAHRIIFDRKGGSVAGDGAATTGISDCLTVRSPRERHDDGIGLRRLISPDRSEPHSVRRREVLVITEFSWKLLSCRVSATATTLRCNSVPGGARFIGWSLEQVKRCGFSASPGRGAISFVVRGGSRSRESSTCSRLRTPLRMAISGSPRSPSTPLPDHRDRGQRLLCVP